MFDKLPSHWTVAVFVPNIQAEHEAKRFGFPSGNVEKWDTSSVRGLENAGARIREVTSNYMTARSTGTFRGTTSLFNMTTANLNKAVVKSSLVELPDRAYYLLDIYDMSPGKPILIADFVARSGIAYQVGMGYYQLTKSEKIQQYKEIAVHERKTGKVYTGKAARDILGLPDYEIRVRPQDNPEFDVFVQSTSVNRHLVVGTKLLLLR